MGLRATLEKKPVLGITGAVVMIVLAAALMVRSMTNQGSHEVNAAYYTTDDGKTWFAAGIDHVAPFEHEGKEAVKVYLFRCGDRGKPFVAYLERFTPQGKKQVEKMWADARARANKDGTAVAIDRVALYGATMSATEVKKPGESHWYPMQKAPPYVTQVHCPDGGSLSDVHPVLP
jgi:hypothetical protein